MKKFLIVFFAMLMMSSIVNAATFKDTENLNCDYAVERLAYLKIVNGTTENTFEPQKMVTRAEFSKMIINALKNINNGNFDKSFSDIDGHWAKEYILKASNNGILNGYSDGTFCPNNNVSYAEAIAIVMRCLGYTNLEENVQGKWYSNYISEMQKINLDYELQDFSPESYANRGDIAILIWNMLSSNYRVNSNESLLKEHFSEYNYWNNAKVNDITAYSGNVVYVTSNGNAIIEDNIDFSDLGGVVSGFYDKNNQILIGKKTDEGQKTEHVFGNLKSLTSYAPFKSSNVYGYGDKNYAEYVEIFLEKGTNNIVRVVFYDTRESHFAENIKIGNNKISIESRDRIEKIKIYLDNGDTRTYDVLLTDSVKDIDKNAILVSNGKVISWTDLPNNSVIREIKEDMIYTFVNRPIDGKIDKCSVLVKTITVDGTEYDVAEDCICQNVVTNQTMRLKDGLTRNDIYKISDNKDKVRIYLNEFDEIVKLEFEYDIWGAKQKDEEKESNKDAQEYLDRLGFVTSAKFDYKDDEDEYYDERVRVSATASSPTTSFVISKGDFKIGDFVYNRSGEGLMYISKSTSFDEVLDLEYNYTYTIVDGKIGNYSFNDESEIIEVLVQLSESNSDKYSSCKLRQVTLDELSKTSRYKNIIILADKNGNVVRMYAVKEIGSLYNFGIVSRINNVISGDKIVETSVTVHGSSGGLKTYASEPVMRFEVGDLITYETNNGKIYVEEIYNHKIIGSAKDLIVDKYKKGKISFKNSDIIIDTNLKNFEFNDNDYYFEDLIFINAEILKNEEDEWIFSSIKNSNQNKITVKENDRIAINELTNTFIVYSGYSEDK